MRKQVNLSEWRIFRKSWWQHIPFWIVVLFILLNIFKSSASFSKIDLIYTLIFASPLAAVTYLNLYILIPRLLSREKYMLFALAAPLLTLLGAVFLYLLFDRWIDLVLPNYYFISYYTVWQLMLFTGSLMVLTTLLKLSRSWFSLLRMERMTASNRLMALQRQINPHFLLNSLQTIYALSLDDSALTPKVILKLSDILKYTLYETENPRISLEEEMKMVSDYVDMYRYRVDREKVEISLRMDGDPLDLKIAPMLLIPFIENCFKHGMQKRRHKTKIDISLLVSDSHLEFRAVNSLGEGPNPGGNPQNNSRRGIGTENTKERLELLYPGKHRLSLGAEKAHFVVSLDLQLDK